MKEFPPQIEGPFGIAHFPIGGHLGFLKMYHIMKKDIFWEGLKNDVQNFVSKCVVYQ
jgi:hypothetical protein